MSKPWMTLWSDNEPGQKARDAIAHWHRELDAGSKAELRRCHDATEVAFSAHYVRLFRLLSHDWNVSERALPVVAGLLAHVRLSSDGSPAEHRSLAEQMATPREGAGKPAFSELRFRRLIQRHEPEEVYSGLLRVVKLFKGQVNPARLAEAAYHWGHEPYRQQVALRYWERAPQE